MNIEGALNPIDQQPELPKVEASVKPPVDDSEGLASRDLKAEEAARKRDQAKIAKSEPRLA
ncbi:hypothetical protein HYW87_04755 [Candidatus Roizmanbacteria bacterium]|nr:hypothetical protein [Candidatus Roizmanbacteria bacterium]